MTASPPLPPNSNFFSSGLRQKVDQLMDILWSGGVNNPMDSIEQISYLLFLRLLSERDEQFALLDKKYPRIFSGKWSRFAWGNFVTLTGDHLFDTIRDAIEKFHELPGLTDTGKLLFSRATLKIYDRPTLRAVVQAIHEMDLAAHDGHDFKGDMYEYLLSKLAASGTNGQFRTPRHIIDLITAQAVISFPSGVFKPYSGVGTAALIFQKNPVAAEVTRLKFPATESGKKSEPPYVGCYGTKSVWFYDLTADGYSLDDKRTRIEANDIPDVIAKWPGREEGPNSYRVPLPRIQENDWSLAAGRYKPVTTETVTHDTPKDILGDVLKLENEIIRRGGLLLRKLPAKD